MPVQAYEDSLIKMRLFATILLVFILGSPAFADERDALYEELKAAPNEVAARLIEDQIWLSWLAGPTEEATALVKKAMERRRWYDFAGALVHLDKAAVMAPRWAEVYNQRAYIHFLRDDFDKSLEDIEKALEFEPRHFAALSGKARILIRQGRMKLGQEALREAVDIYPYLRERHMLLPVPGEKL